MPRTLYYAALLFAAALVAACSSERRGESGPSDAAPDGDDRPIDGGTPPDGGGDAGRDAGRDAATGTTARCEVQAGSGDATVYRGVVLTPDEALPEAEVVTEGERIACVGEDCAAEFSDATVVDCGGAVISPALINPHDHMLFNETGPHEELGDRRYDHRHEWRGELSTPQNPSGTGTNSTGMRWNELRHLMAGTTTVVGSGNASGIMRHLDDLGPRELGQGFRRVSYETFPLGDSDAQHDDVLIPPESCDDWNWSFRANAFNTSMAAAYLPHVAEGIDEYAADEFRCQSQEYDDGGRDFTHQNASHIHSIGLNAADLHRMATAGTRLVWSPRTNIALYGVTADVSTFHRFGGTIALGTDWAYTGSANMLRELECADSYNRDYLSGIFSDRELWAMATQNAAIATGNDHAIGSLEEGKIADLLIVDGAPGEYRAVLEAGSADVLLVSVAGEPFYGEANVLEGVIGDDCDPVDVCGEDRGVCLSRNLETSYDELTSNISDEAYPLLFCDEPEDEPTCVPSRPGEFTGLPDGDDSIGDGVPDDEDLCPEVFHPIRPIDDGVQQDADGDGVGDPCDDDPVPSDISGDGFLNEDDNCPYDENPDQTETPPLDGTGDMCDACPDIANPHGPCPPITPATIQEVYTEVEEDEDVVVLGAVVTGIHDSGITIQDPDPEDGDPRQSGLSVFTFQTTSHLEVGDVVNVSGEKDLFIGNVEIGSARIGTTGATASIEPTEVSAEEAASDDYLGVLVEIAGAEVTDEDYDCSQDNSNCNDDGLWEIGEGDDAVLVFDRLYQDADWDERVGELPVTGVMMLRFGRHRVMPRTGDDF